MRRGKRMSGLLILALLLSLAGAARGEMYVEGYMGGNFSAPSSDPYLVQPDPTWNAAAFRPNLPGAIDPAFHGGLKIGTWFVKEGVLGFDYPEWMKYLGFYTDFSYHRLDFRKQYGSKTVAFGMSGVPTAPTAYPVTAFSHGYAITWAFMFAARCGFLPDQEVPFGRLQPYLAVGPAILWSGQKGKATSWLPAFPTATKTDELGPDSRVDVALVVETGLRWMALKNVSIDVSFKYRYAQPTYKFGVIDEEGGVHRVNLDPTFHLFSFQVGAAYHF